MCGKGPDGGKGIKFEFAEIFVNNLQNRGISQLAEICSSKESKGTILSPRAVPIIEGEPTEKSCLRRSFSSGDSLPKIWSMISLFDDQHLVTISGIVQTKGRASFQTCSLGRWPIRILTHTTRRDFDSGNTMPEGQETNIFALCRAAALPHN